MSRPRRLTVGLVIAVVAIAGILPGIGGLDIALAELPWILLPDETPATPPVAVVLAGERPSALRSLLPPRAPPLPVAA
jgi:hypothetical protein